MAVKPYQSTHEEQALNHVQLIWVKGLNGDYPYGIPGISMTIIDHPHGSPWELGVNDY